MQRDSLTSFVRDVVDAIGLEVVRRVRADEDALVPPDKWAMWTDW